MRVRSGSISRECVNNNYTESPRRPPSPAPPLAAAVKLVCHAVKNWANEDSNYVNMEKCSFISMSSVVSLTIIASHNRVSSYYLLSNAILSALIEGLDLFLNSYFAFRISGANSYPVPCNE